MTLITVIDMYDKGLEGYLPTTVRSRWHVALEGYWREGIHHSGHIAYLIQKTKQGAWVMKSVQRNAILDDVTWEDVRKGHLNDDQIQALCGTTLRAAKKARYEVIVAVLVDAPEDMTMKTAAKSLYGAALRAGCPKVTEIEESLLD